MTGGNCKVFPTDQHPPREDGERGREGEAGLIVLHPKWSGQVGLVRGLTLQGGWRRWFRSALLQEEVTEGPAVCVDCSLGFRQGSLRARLCGVAPQTPCGAPDLSSPFPPACPRSRASLARVPASTCPSQKTTRPFRGAAATPRGALRPLPATCRATTSTRRTAPAT